MADYIDRTSIIEAIEECQTMTGEAKFVARVLIYAEPSADVQPVVHGHWTWEEGVFVYGIDRDALGSYRCTACENCSPHMTNYCPNCGARMVNK